ncbi:hypothetical protein CGC49_09405 [Capnocytophaga sp. H4358]|nr:hypothetical protein CGC49_09405 [Capnocytophaga sp. H4358]
MSFDLQIAIKNTSIETLNSFKIRQCILFVEDKNYVCSLCYKIESFLIEKAILITFKLRYWIIFHNM